MEIGGNFTTPHPVSLEGLSWLDFQEMYADMLH